MRLRNEHKNYRDCPVRLNTNHRHGQTGLQIFKVLERLVGSDEPLNACKGLILYLCKAMDANSRNGTSWHHIASREINPLINNAEMEKMTNFSSQKPVI